MRRTRRPTGFTLVELLVVIGIIALLVAMLLPALNKARRASQTVACLSNLRQIGLGIIMYASEQHGQLPAGQWENWTPGDDARWYTLINPYMGGEGNTVQTARLDHDDRTLTRALICPGAAVQAGYNHYSSNPVAMGRKQEFNEKPGMPHLKLSQLRPSSRIILVWDGNQHVTNGNAQTVGFMADHGIPFWGRFGLTGIKESDRHRELSLHENADGTATPPRGRIRWRHGNNNAVNVVFADGHAATHQHGTLTNNNTFPDGWRPKP